MLTMTNINDIRRMYFEEGMSKTKIKRKTNFSRKTIRKYIEKSDWNKNICLPNSQLSKLTRYKSDIDRWLESDKEMRKKQRHTAKRIFDRLKELYGNEFDCSYRTVAGYVSKKRKEIFGNNDDFYLPLEHKPGEAQIDFGDADFIENGKRYRGKYLNVSFPYSNAGFMQLFKGENFECLAQGMVDIFKYISGVPNRQWFDNMSTAVHGIKEDKSRELTNAFSRLKNHYNFKAVFCNFAAGNEKGSVENKVGYHRRNLLVPIPECKDLRDYNRILLEKCFLDMERKHYKKGLLIKALFAEDKKHLIPLPAEDFRASKIKSVRIDAYAKFRINKGKHIYSTMPKLAKKSTQIEITAHEVIIYDEKINPVLKHKRLYSNETEAMNWLPYLTQLSKRPNALKYTGIYEMFPYPLQQWLVNCNKKELSDSLKLIAEMSDKSSFNTAVKILQKSIEYGTFDPDSVKALYELESQSFPDINDFELADNINEIKVKETELMSYDLFIPRGQQDGVTNVD
jgi:transposase